LQNKHSNKSPMNINNPLGIDDSKFPNMLDLIKKYGNNFQRKIAKELQDEQKKIYPYILEIRSILNDTNKFMYMLFTRSHNKIYKFAPLSENSYTMFQTENLL